jgi:hypothetical protein
MLLKPAPVVSHEHPEFVVSFHASVCTITKGDSNRAYCAGGGVN